MENLKAGDLDPGFGQGGRLELAGTRANIAFRKFYQDERQRILGVGSSEVPGEVGIKHVTVVRYTSDGRLDDSFRENGYWLHAHRIGAHDDGLDLGLQDNEAFVVAIVEEGQIILLSPAPDTGEAKKLPITPKDGKADAGAIMTVEKNGRLWVACSYLMSVPDKGGQEQTREEKGRVLLARCKPDGYPDKDFAEEGKRILEEDDSLQLLDMTLRPDKRDVILALRVGSIGSSTFYLYCLDANTGAFKQDFGEGGKFTYQLPDPAYRYTSFKSVLYDKGQLLLVGNTVGAAGEAFCFLVRLTPDGLIDQDFNNGKPIVEKGLEPSIGVQSNGKVLLMASIIYPNNILRRYLPSGDLDLEFGQAGAVSVGRDIEEIRNLFVQSDDKLVLGAYVGTTGLYSQALYRLIG